MADKMRFKKIAPYYDILMKDINYKGWVNYVLKIFDRKGKHPTVILDLGCGTGIPTILLAQNGFKVYAIDSSEEMLSVLKEKIEKNKIRCIIPLKKDMRKFRLPEKMDAVVSFFDTINYLLEEKDLLDCYKSVFNVLKKGGIFVFDINTLYGLEKVWGTNVFVREVENVFSVWKSVWDSKNRTSTLYLTLFIKNGANYVRIDETHKEKAFSLSEHRKFLEKAGFHQVEFFHHLTFSKPFDISSRVMVVAEK